MKNNKGFSIIELLVSFVIISFLTIAMFKAVSVLSDKLFYYQHTSRLTVFKGTFMNAIQKDFTTNGLLEITTCGTNCYDIIFSAEETKRLTIDTNEKILRYDTFAERLPNDASFSGGIIMDGETIGSGSNAMGIAQITIPISSDIYDENYDIDVVFQFNGIYLGPDADREAPVITMLGISPVTITQGDVYIDAGATAVDAVDGNITSNIQPVGFVNPNIHGTYYITYNVSDSSGNAATPVTRTVIVEYPYLFVINPVPSGAIFNGTGEVGQFVYKTVGTYTLTPIRAGEIEVFIVAGGGGGGQIQWVDGGGGGGGVIHRTSFSIGTSSITVTVGNGGAVNVAGQNSVFGSLTALGGGRGPNGNGGSGGGGASSASGSTTPGSATQPSSPSAGMGNSGGSGVLQAGGGGGGATTAGLIGDNTNRRGGHGGQGYTFAGQVYGSGGAGTGDYSVGTSGTNAGSGQPYFGGGGLGRPKGGAASPGGSGIVIIRWGGYNVSYNPNA